MGRQNIVQVEEKPPNPILPVLGFVLVVVVGGLAFLVSPRVVVWLKTTHFSLAFGLLPVLPIKFPQGWSPLTNQLVVTAFMFLVIFTLVMSTILFVTSKSAVGETDVNLDEIRREKQKRMKRRR